VDIEKYQRWNPINVETETSLRFNTLGFEMGYNLFSGSGFSLDLVLLGPGVAFYNLKAKINTNLSEADIKSNFYDKLNEALSEKFPGYAWAIDEGEFLSKGSSNTTSLGYRYVNPGRIQVLVIWRNWIKAHSLSGEIKLLHI
jgi:hypothetical protein